MPVIGGLPEVVWNSEESVRDNNIAINDRRNVQRFITQGKPPRAGKVCIVGGGPSLGDCLDLLRAHYQNGAEIWATNNTFKYLMDRGIKPAAHVFLDPRPENIKFVHPTEGVKYYLHKWCDPAIYDLLKGQDVCMYDLRVDGTGTTVGLKSLYLAGFLGYRDFVLYGFDSSYVVEGEIKHHAYEQKQNDDENVQWVKVGDREFLCAPWMLVQTEEFMSIAYSFAEQGAVIKVAGDGLLPYVAQRMMAQKPPQKLEISDYKPFGKFIIAFHLQGYSGNTDPFERARMLCLSAKQFMPQAHIIQLTTPDFPACPYVDEVLRLPKNEDFGIQGFSGMAEICHRGLPVLVVGSDVLFQSDISHVFNHDFDVAACRYPNSLLGAYCSDVVFSQPSGQRVWDEALDYYLAHPYLQDGWEGTQYAFYEASLISQLRYCELDWDTYCHTPESEDNDYSKGKLIHFRGARKQWMEQVFNRIYQPT